MLVATYALVTLTVEQRCERSCIQAVLQALAKSWDPAEFDAAPLMAALEKLVTLAESTHWRRLEFCLIPAIREASGGSGCGMGAIETLGRNGKQMLPLIRRGLRCPAEFTRSQTCGRLQEYCQNLLERLDCEEDQIVPLAQRLLDTEAWLRVGLGFLHQDTLQDMVIVQPAPPRWARSGFRETLPGP